MKKNNILPREEVLHIAKLACLDLSEKEVKDFQLQLGEILAFMDVLKELKLNAVKATSQVSGLEYITRADKIKNSLSADEAKSQAKKTYKSFFQVRAVLE